MTAYITYEPGQTILDLCLTAYGTADMLGRFCTDNNVADITGVPILSRYKYDTSLVKYEGNSYKFATAVVTEAQACTAITGLTVTATAVDSISYAWSPTPRGDYEYAINDTGATPTEWIATGSTSRTISGLYGDTEYFFFVRNKCGVNDYSPPTSVAHTTAADTPVLPITAGLILSVFASSGLDTDAGDVVGWNDLSAKGNDMEVAAGTPTYTNGLFGRHRGVVMQSGDALSTILDFDGIYLEDAVTIFMVKQFAAPVSAKRVIHYGDGGSLTADGTFETYIQAPSGLEVSTLIRGDVGVNTGVLPATASTPSVFTYVVDLSAGVGNEIQILRNDSATGFAATGSNDNTNTFAEYKMIIGGSAIVDVACIVAYAGAMSPTDITTVTDYLKAYYDIA